MGGSKRRIPVVALCRPCHTRITLNEWTNKVMVILGVVYYVVWDVRGHKLCERVLEEGRNGTTAAAEMQPATDGEAGRVEGVPSVRPRVAEATATFSEWEARGHKLKDGLERTGAVMVSLAFDVGDWVNEGEELFGEEASQCIDAFSYWQVNRWAKLAREIPPENRDLCNVANLTVEHFRAVAGLPPPEQREWLLAAARGEMSAAKLRAALAPSERAETEPCVCPACGTKHRAPLDREWVHG
jgi:hypothetical protein